MAKGIYVGVAGVARKVGKQYLGIAGVARKAKSGFAGVAGVARQFFSGATLVTYNFNTNGATFRNTKSGNSRDNLKTAVCKFRIGDSVLNTVTIDMEKKTCIVGSSTEPLLYDASDDEYYWGSRKSGANGVKMNMTTITTYTAEPSDCAPYNSIVDSLTFLEE